MGMMRSIHELSVSEFEELLRRLEVEIEREEDRVRKVIKVAHSTSDPDKYLMYAQKFFKEHGVLISENEIATKADELKEVVGKGKRTKKVSKPKAVESSPVVEPVEEQVITVANNDSHNERWVDEKF